MEPTIDSLDPDVFWVQDPTILYRNNLYLELIPSRQMSRPRQLNCLSRFCFWFLVMTLIFGGPKMWYLPLGVLLVILVLYFLDFHDPKRGQKETTRYLNLRTEERRLEEQELDQMLALPEIDALQPELASRSSSLTLIGNSHDSLDNHQSGSNHTGSNYDVQVGTLGPEGEVVFPDQASQNSTLATEVYAPEELLEPEEIHELTKANCRKPTHDNPYMNPSPMEYGQGEAPSACNVDDEEIKTQMHQRFTEDLFRDVGDLWERHNSERQYYTLPNTKIPNDQRAFAEWCYKDPPSCKTGASCVRYENLRYKR